MAEITGEIELTAGQMLRQARTTGRRKRELDTIARLLCIRKEFLDALENDDFGRIPELVYILGFARNYAMELELDPYVIVDKIKRQMGLIEEKDEAEIDREDSAGIMDKAQQEPGTGQWLRRSGKIITVIAIALVVAGSAAMIINAHKQEPATLNTTAAVGSEAAAAKYNRPIGREYGIRNKDYAAIVLQATGTTWVQIKNSAGNIVFEHSMMDGDVYYALNGATATIGNAGALDIWVNGHEIPKHGAERQRLLDVFLTPESLMK
jgi:cytoskeletal protein RodZ